MTWGRPLYFPCKRRSAADFITLKNPMPLAEFEPANLFLYSINIVNCLPDYTEIKVINQLQFF
jgi:hypothetical protein